VTGKGPGVDYRRSNHDRPCAARSAPLERVALLGFAAPAVQLAACVHRIDRLHLEIRQFPSEFTGASRHSSARFGRFVARAGTIFFEKL